MSSIARRLLVGGGVSLFSILIVKGMAFLNFVIAARLLSPEDYGVLSIVLNLQNFAIVVAGVGIPIAVTKKVSQWLSKDVSAAQAVGSTLVLIAVVSSMATGVGYLLLSEQIAGSLYKDPALASIFRLSAVFVMIASVNVVLSALVQGCQLITSLARINAFVAVIWQPISYVAISAVGIEGAIAAMMISNSLSIVLFVWVSSKVLPLSFTRAMQFFRQRSEVRSLVMFTIPVFITTVMISPTYWIGRTVLALEWDFSAVGHFQIAESLAQVLLALSLALSIPLLPLVSEQHAVNPAALGRMTGKILKLAVFLIAPFSVLILPFLGDVISFLYGAGYESAQSPAVMMFAAYSFIAAGSVISTVIFGIGRAWDALWINLAWMLVFLSLVYLIVPSYSYDGLASAYAVSYGFYVALMLAYFSRSFKVGVLSVGSFLTAFGAYIALYVAYVSEWEFAWRLVATCASTLVFSLVGYRVLLGPDERRALKSAVGLVLRRSA